MDESCSRSIQRGTVHQIVKALCWLRPVCPHIFPLSFCLSLSIPLSLFSFFLFFSLLFLVSLFLSFSFSLFGIFVCVCVYITLFLFLSPCSLFLSLSLSFFLSFFLFLSFSFCVIFFLFLAPCWRNPAPHLQPRSLSHRPTAANPSSGISTAVSGPVIHPMDRTHGAPRPRPTAVRRKPYVRLGLAVDQSHRRFSRDVTTRARLGTRLAATLIGVGVLSAMMVCCLR